MKDGLHLKSKKARINASLFARNWRARPDLDLRWSG